MDIIVLSLLASGIQADRALGYYDISTASIAGEALAITYLVISCLGLLLTIASLTIFVEKPVVLKVLGIITAGIFIIGMIIMIAGAGLNAQSIGNIYEELVWETDPVWIAHDQLDIANGGAVVGCLIAAAVISLLGIFSTVKVILYLLKKYPRSATLIPRGAAQQQKASLPQGQGKFCSSCGTQNEANAKFCKNCAKPF